MTEADAAPLLREHLGWDDAVTALGDGEDHWVFAARGHVLRFPKGDADALAGEIRLLAWLAPRLPLAVPAYDLVVDGPRPFAGYPAIPGVPALGRDLAIQRLGPTLGRFLRALHALPVEAPAHGLSEEAPALDEWTAEALEDLAGAEARGHVDADERRALEAILRSPPPGVPTIRVLHGDFAAEHVLVADGAPVGVIDWSDAALGDPARDLAGLVHWGGAPLLAAALDAYGSVDADTIGRARWYATCRALADLTFGAERGWPIYVEAGRRALASASDERAFARCVAGSSR